MIICPLARRDFGEAIRHKDKAEFVFNRSGRFSIQHATVDQRECGNFVGLWLIEESGRGDAVRTISGLVTQRD